MRTIRLEVVKDTKYSSQLSSFETHLKAAAFAIIEAPLEPVPPQYALLPVGADWITRDPILGYPDALDPSNYVTTPALDLILRADRDRSNPYFLILDEMNLSHVERYFADILSAMESGEPIILHSGPTDRNGIPPQIDRLPENLYIIGTVNVDETTYMFSPKVLDRANVIEFRVSANEMAAYLDNPQGVDLDKLAGLGQQFGQAFVAQTKTKEIELAPDIQTKLKTELLLFFQVFADHGAEFGFRTAKEITRFIYFHQQLVGEGWQFRDAMDAQILQKLLPKLHGSRKKMEPLLNALAVLCYEQHHWQLNDEQQLVLTNEQDLSSNARRARTLDNNGPLGQLPEAAYYPLSFEKIQRMLKALDQNGFTSFAEA